MLKRILLYIVLFSFMVTYAETMIQEPDNIRDINAGSNDNPYIIATLGNLRWLSESKLSFDKDVYFVQVNDIDATETMTWNNGSGFKPIQLKLNQKRECEGITILFWSFNQNYNIKTKSKAFYNGNDLEISNLYINGKSNLGLFGNAKLVSLYNINLNNITVIGRNNIGTLVGKGEMLKIFNCKVSGNIKGNNNVGGIIGKSTMNFVINNVVNINIKANNYVGGISGDVKMCYFIDNSLQVQLQGHNVVGGIAGNCSKLSFNKGSIKGNVCGNSPLCNKYANGSYSVSKLESQNISIQTLTKNSIWQSVYTFLYKVKIFAQTKMR